MSSLNTAWSKIPHIHRTNPQHLVSFSDKDKVYFVTAISSYNVLILAEGEVTYKGSYDTPQAFPVKANKGTK